MNGGAIMAGGAAAAEAPMLARKVLGAASAERRTEDGEPVRGPPAGSLHRGPTAQPLFARAGRLGWLAIGGYLLFGWAEGVNRVN